MSNDAEVRAAVTQEDRIAAADLYRYVADKVKEAHHLDIPRHTMHETLAGEWDHGGFVQAFARHRIAAEEWEAMREALEPFAIIGRAIAANARDNRWHETVLFYAGTDDDPSKWSLTGKAFANAAKVSAVPLFDEGRL